MEPFVWWNDEQRKLALDTREFVDGIMPRAEEAWWKEVVPWDLIKAMADKGYFGVGVAKQYGGMGLGATGTTIVTEELCRLPSIGEGVFIASIIGGVHQIIEFGSEEQKSRFLPRVARGELGAVAITEPFVGTDAAGIETTARRDNDRYIVTGKKRFITGAGLADRYLLYTRTSDNPEEIQQNQHLTAFIVERGMPGFTVEKINELIGLDNLLNGVLNLDEVVVPVANRIGGEGDGWRMMTTALNYERVIIAASSVGKFREVLKTLVPYGQRRIQFNQPTINMPNNQFKVADMILQLKLARQATYYAAHLLDLGHQTAVESSICKVYSSDALMQSSVDAVQVMGGDGVTKFYPLQRIMKDAKINQITGGTSEAVKLVIYRMGLREMADELKMPRRIKHEELRVPITANESLKRGQINEEALLKSLAEDYTVNPGLYMSRDDLKEEFEVDDKELDKLLQSLEQKKLVKLYHSKKGISLAKATYEGLKKANLPEDYQWFPPRINEEDIF